MGVSFFKTFSTRAFIFTSDILSFETDLSIRTRDKRSSMIPFSLSISDAISCINSLYTSTGVLGSARSESASSFIEVIGVLSSCDTFETNSSFEASSSLALSSISLK